MTINQDIYYVYVGTYGAEQEEAIQLLEFNARDTSFKKIASTTGIKNPSYLTVNQEQNRLYAVSEIVEGEVASFAVDLATLKLTELNRQVTKGHAPCYVALDQKEKFLFTVNYGEGTTTVHAIENDGSLGSLTDLKSYKGKQPSHPHTIVQIPDTNKYIVTDLGFNKLYLYEFDYETSTLVLINEIAAVAESGPRHIALEPTVQKIYVVNEFNSKISVYSYDQLVENFELIQEISTLPADYEGENHCADIHIAHSKSFLYASNRGHHSIAVFKILKDGTLEVVTQVSTTGEWPRNFVLVPNEKHMLIANEHTNSIVAMAIDENGIPQPTGSEYAVKAPVCLQAIEKK